VNHPQHSRPGPAPRLVITERLAFPHILFPPLQLRARMSEDAFQQWVVDLAKVYGWRHYHTRFSKRSPSGFPDLVLARDGRLIFAELKSEKGHLTPEQREWMADLARVAQRLFMTDPDTVREFLWRPSDMEQIEKVLR